MKIVITESQYRRFKQVGVIKEQVEPFYEYFPTSKLYVYNPGNTNKKPQGSIDAKQLFKFIFPYGPPKGYPQRLTSQEVNDIYGGSWVPSELKQAKDKLNSGQISRAEYDKIENNTYRKDPNREMLQGAISQGVEQLKKDVQGTPPTPLPNDWQSEEKNYAAFNEPLGKSDRTVPGKYKKLLPAQTNKYFYDPNLEVKTQQKVLNQAGKTVNQTTTKKGGWVVKTLANVDSWRDVPAGYYPPDYPKALEFEKQQDKIQQGSNTAGSESTSVNKQLKLQTPKNPYYRPEFPLGNSQENLKIYDDQMKAKQREAERASMEIYGERPVPGSDHFAGVDLKKQQKMEGIIMQGINTEIDEINDAFGRYVDEQKSKGDDRFEWVGFLLTVASVLPVVGQAAMVLNIGYNLGNAIISYNKGDYAQAGFSLLLAVVPQVNTYLKGANPLNFAARSAGAETAERWLAENSAKLFTEVTSKLSGGISRNLATKAANNPQVLLTLEKLFGKVTGEMSARAIGKNIAADIDKGNLDKNIAGLK